MSEYLFKTDKEIMTCQECPIVKKYGLSTTCPLREGAERKYGTCPLEEVQPHGRLIDADDIQEVLRLVQALIMTEKLSDSEIRLVQKTLGAISEAINEIDAVLEASTESTEEREWV